MTGSIYRTTVDAEAPNNSQAIALQLIGSGKRVLELGAAAGDVSRALRARGNCVVGVECDASVAETAEGVVIADLDWLDLPNRLAEETFDVVLAGDVLEHMREPHLFLRQLHRLLAPRGCVIASIPNIAHADVRLSLLSGEFEYRDKGLLDRTHLRFFTKASLRRMFDQAGYDITHVLATWAQVGTTELRVDLSVHPQDLIDRLARDSEATTYQYVVRAEPREGARAPGIADSPVPVVDPVRSLSRELGALRAQTEAQTTELEDELARAKSELRDVREAKEHFERLAEAREGAIAHLEGVIFALEMERTSRVGVHRFTGRLRVWPFGRTG
jgi:2-polyprenyl-3-methyl-5-hydroxy-6-metoxy-1,4-benzoquinol methylase